MYVKYHKPVGNFLKAVLQNDLRTAVCNADPDSYAALREIVLWVHNEAEPGHCWGSPEAYTKWISEFDPADLPAPRPDHLRVVSS
jgi:hypothetical protein